MSVNLCDLLCTLSESSILHIAISLLQLLTLTCKPPPTACSCLLGLKSLAACSFPALLLFPLHTRPHAGPTPKAPSPIGLTHRLLSRLHHAPRYPAPPLSNLHHLSASASAPSITFASIHLPRRPPLALHHHLSLCSRVYLSLPLSLSPYAVPINILIPIPVSFLLLSSCCPPIIDTLAASILLLFDLFDLLMLDA